MPFKSQKQERFMFSQHPQIAQRWAQETPNQAKLPQYAHLNQHFAEGGQAGPTPEQLKALEQAKEYSSTINAHLSRGTDEGSGKQDRSLASDGSQGSQQFPELNGGWKKADSYKDGGKVPGIPTFAGNDPRNDVVKAKLSKGEVVLPNSVTHAPNAPEEAKKFMLLHHYFGGGKPC